MTRLFQILATGLTACLIAISARAEEVLTLHTFMSPKSPTVTKMLEPWADRIAEQSGGKLRVEIFPSMAMGGKPPELYKQVRDGVADIVWTLPGYTPGVFPRSEVFELPTVHAGDAKATTMAIQELMPMIAADFEDIHPLLIHVHAGNAIHLAENEIAGPNGLKGLKLRTPSRTGAWLIEALDAEPVGMPLPALPQALSKNGVDGALVPFEIFPPFKLQELTKFSAEGEDGTRFGTSVFLFAMNKDRYEALPDDLKAVIDAASDSAFAAEMGAVWNANEAPGIAFQEKAGNKVMRFGPETMAAFAARGEAVVTRWVEDSKTQGFDGAALVEAARTAVAKHSE